MRPWRHISSASCFALKPGLSFAFWKASYTGLDSGLVHTVEATAANVHDVTEASRLLTGDEDEVYGDSGYLGAGKREDAAEQRRTSSRQRGGTREVICTSKSGTRIRGRKEAATLLKDRWIRNTLLCTFPRLQSHFLPGKTIWHTTGGVTCDEEKGVVLLHG